ncbi:MAG: hypothetical protein R2697_03500 [Ilumatobacteraceae bacterium]
MTVHDVPAVVHVRPPGVAVAVYDEMSAPPSCAGAVHDTSAVASPARAVVPVGASGTCGAMSATNVSAPWSGCSAEK